MVRERNAKAGGRMVARVVAELSVLEGEVFG
jgi:hypothetical protein